jgi:hypothetical protein
MKRRTTLALMGAGLLGACAAPVGNPVLPRMRPLRLTLSNEGINIQVVLAAMPGPGIIPGMMSSAADRANREGTETLRKQLAARQQGEALAKLFETELHQRFAAKGGLLEASAGNTGAPEIRLDHLSAVYMASNAAASYSPVAFVYLASSTDPSLNRPGAQIRSVEAKPAAKGLTFPTLDALQANPDKANEGLRLAIVELAERVAAMLAAAQKQG